jgi:hypothetical protein
MTRGGMGINDVNPISAHAYYAHWGELTNQNANTMRNRPQAFLTR